MATHTTSDHEDSFASGARGRCSALRASRTRYLYAIAPKARTAGRFSRGGSALEGGEIVAALLPRRAHVTRLRALLEQRSVVEENP